MSSQDSSKQSVPPPKPPRHIPRTSSSLPTSPTSPISPTSSQSKPSFFQRLRKSSKTDMTRYTTQPPSTITCGSLPTTQETLTQASGALSTHQSFPSDDLSTNTTIQSTPEPSSIISSTHDASTILSAPVISSSEQKSSHDVPRPSSLGGGGSKLTPAPSLSELISIPSSTHLEVTSDKDNNGDNGNNGGNGGNGNNNDDGSIDPTTLPQLPESRTGLTYSVSSDGNGGNGGGGNGGGGNGGGGNGGNGDGGNGGGGNGGGDDEEPPRATILSSSSDTFQVEMPDLHQNVAAAQEQNGSYFGIARRIAVAFYANTSFLLKVALMLVILNLWSHYVLDIKKVEDSLRLTNEIINNSINMGPSFFDFSKNWQRTETTQKQPLVDVNTQPSSLLDTLRNINESDIDIDIDTLNKQKWIKHISTNIASVEKQNSLKDAMLNILYYKGQNVKLLQSNKLRLYKILRDDMANHGGLSSTLKKLRAFGDYKNIEEAALLESLLKMNDRIENRITNYIGMV
ncbi:hypothetical protein BDA99DRAFT_540751 [Phascolomyces articulosus]|uniref:Uncharacterized protein n=1 Tax=Phascolomyces articulosus TaxID=60185 RepID=A0AAD5JTC4_9FUNG|nr:hypothetical protein BDA99DRAFT_540751 [Phascolomyces articulosus]